MCGITGIYAFNQIGRFNMINLVKATEVLESRGPDNQGLFHNEFVGLGHRRLSIIDTSPEANQPMIDASGRYRIVFNGEIYNYRQLKQELEAEGVTFRTQSDTEVLLELYVRRKTACLQHLNGFFAFAIYDQREDSIFIARDRYGIKPLHYYQDQDKVIFASEVKSLLMYGIEKQLDTTTLYSYLQLNYIPAPLSMFKGVKKLEPGCFLTITKNGVEHHKYYSTDPGYRTRLNFSQSVEHFQKIMEESVTDRLVSDVPLGTFLSGGLDSSVVSAIAAKHVQHLQTFSIGYKDEPFFDETGYANSVAKHIGSDHTVFKLSNQDLYDHVFQMLDYMDEPFADSSTIAVNILSKETRKHVAVALSGDGADELFAGYNKHAAMLRMLNPGWKEHVVNNLLPLWKALPQSRNGFISNKIRQFHRYASVSRLSPAEQYWALASISDGAYASTMLEPLRDQINHESFISLKDSFTRHVPENKPSITDSLMADLQLVLPNDMLTKVDMMSMRNSLEIRVPFLDQRVVEFAFSLPDEMKINPQIRKRIVQEAFKGWLPRKLYNRPKKGFEVPLMKWFQTEMRPLIENDLLADDYIAEQKIFNVKAVRQLKKYLFSPNPGDTQARIWALITFQWWYKKYFIE